MLQIYHNPRCRTSRTVLIEIRKKDVKVEVIEYLKDIPSVEDLKTLMIKLHLKPLQIVRTKEDLFKKKYKGKNFTDEEWLQILHENPILIERPIVVMKNKAIICRPIERINEII